MAALCRALVFTDFERSSEPLQANIHMQFPLNTLISAPSKQLRRIWNEIETGISIIPQD